MYQNDHDTLKYFCVNLCVFEAITCLEFSVNLTVAFVKGDFLPKISTFGLKIDFRRTANSFWLILMNHRLPLFYHTEYRWTRINTLFQDSAFDDISDDSSESTGSSYTNVELEAHEIPDEATLDMICRQVEEYLSDQYLSTDKYLLRQLRHVTIFVNKLTFKNLNFLIFSEF